MGVVGIRLASFSLLDSRFEGSEVDRSYEALANQRDSSRSVPCPSPKLYIGRKALESAFQAPLVSWETSCSVAVIGLENRSREGEIGVRSGRRTAAFLSGPRACRHPGISTLGWKRKQRRLHNPGAIGALIQGQVGSIDQLTGGTMLEGVFF
jgi:hypothetical protein